MTTLGLKNVNMLSKEQYDTVEEPATDELWTVEVETYSDDDGNWYRIYPDGWCEQGGHLIPTATTSTVTFLKPFSDTKYTILTGVGYTSNTAVSTATVAVTKTTSNFTIFLNNTSYNCYWEAKGYIA